MTREEAIDVLSDFRKFTLSILGKSIYADRCSALDMAIEALKADAVQGEWKHTITGQPYCSNCEYVFGEDEEYSPFWNYCPVCGARMKGGEE